MSFRVRTAVSTLAALAAFPAVALAQGLPVGATVFNASATAVAQLESGLDRGGDVRGAAFFASVGATRQFTPELTAGASFRYEFEDWSFPGANVFGGSPWGQIHRPGVAATLVYAHASGYAFTAIPSVQWAYESGASTGDALNWGAILAVSRRFSKDLMVGIGAGVFREIDETEVFPVVLFDWKIDDRLRLGNPYQGGPAGGAGIEITWTANDRWELAGGAAWRTFRFRLDRDGPTPDGIGEREQLPLFARASYRPSTGSRLDFYAGVSLAGKLTVYDRDNRELVSEDHDPAPLLGITFQSRF